jgi:transposase
VGFNEDAINQRLAHVGWLVILSNYIICPKQAIEIYRAKDVIEKCFLMLKNFLDFNRLRVHSSTAMKNKVFIFFLSLILISHIHRVMIENNLYKTLTMKELINIMQSHEMLIIKNTKILKPATATQKKIYSAFRLTAPE